MRGCILHEHVVLWSQAAAKASTAQGASAFASGLFGEAREESSAAADGPLPAHAATTGADAGASPGAPPFATQGGGTGVAVGKGSAAAKAARRAAAAAAAAKVSARAAAKTAAGRGGAGLPAVHGSGGFVVEVSGFLELHVRRLSHRRLEPATRPPRLGAANNGSGGEAVSETGSAAAGTMAASVVPATGMVVYSLPVYFQVQLSKAL